VKIEEYRHMSDVEDKMWWYRNLHENLLVSLKNFGTTAIVSGQKRPVIFDAGCGTGGFLSTLHEHWPTASLFGLDISPEALDIAHKKTGATLVLGSVNEIPFPNEKFDIVICADVLYHKNVEEGQAASELFRCVSKGGVCIVNLPAYGWLRSYHDKQVGGVRRYTLGKAKSLMSSVGFEIKFSTYWNSVLFPLMVAKRKLLHGKQNHTSDVKLMPESIERLFYRLAGLERFALANGIPLPYGGSVLIVCQKMTGGV